MAAVQPDGRTMQRDDILAVAAIGFLVVGGLVARKNYSGGMYVAAGIVVLFWWLLVRGQ
jgi:hypothetical protein